MPIIYSLISRGTQVLADYTLPQHSGNFSQISRVLLKKLDIEHENRLSYLYDEFVFHFITKDSYVFLCMTDRGFLRYHAFQYLGDIQAQFYSLFLSRAATARAYALNAECSPILRQFIEKYNDNKTDEKMSKIREDLSTVKDTMIKNIDRVLERGEKIELLVEKVEQMDNHALKFEKKSKEVKRRFQWKNIRLTLFIVVLILVIAYVLLMVFCHGATIPSCR
jgi:vesicle-associated membrane protein 7